MMATAMPTACRTQCPSYPQVGRRWVWDEGRGGAYHLEGGVLCWAEYLPEVGRFNWAYATQVDSRDLLSDDPGWDYARWAEVALHRPGTDDDRGVGLVYRPGDLTEEEMASLAGEDIPETQWCPACLVEGHDADDCPEAPEGSDG